jgi:CheY-like chemotaxis protein
MTGVLTFGQDALMQIHDAPDAAPRPAPRPPRRPRKPARSKPAAGVRARRIVLLVDDIDDQRELYRADLRRLGFKVLEASSGVEAIARAVDARPDIIIMDLAMPGMDGFGATRVLKRLAVTRRIPVVALTAHGEHLTQEWARAAGCDAYLTKPVLPEDLSAEIRRMVARRRPR